ncbi:MAG: hypothetical protein QOF94_3055 [Acidobacteriaceae bacterium]
MKTIVCPLRGRFNNRRQDTILPYKMAVTIDKIKLSEPFAAKPRCATLVQFVSIGILACVGLRAIFHIESRLGSEKAVIADMGALVAV